jgi:hypothetical protein
MAGRRPTSDRQVEITWGPPRELLDPADGEVVFEAPVVSKIVSGKAPRIPKVKVRRAVPQDPPSLGLPFGVRELSEGRFVCWSCGEDMEETAVVRNSPGRLACPGCGAFLPFAE